MTTMTDLTPGARVRHTQWNETGTIRVLGGVTEIRWDDVFGEIEVSPEGPVFPSDLEIVSPGVPQCRIRPAGTTRDRFGDLEVSIEEPS